MSDTAIHRSLPRSMRRVDKWIWITLHVYAILCLLGGGDLSPFRLLAALCLLQFILAPALLIYMLVTRQGLTRNALLVAVSAVLFLLAAATIYLASRGNPDREFDYAAFWVFFASIISPFIIVIGLLIWNVFTVFELLRTKRLISAALVFLVSLALAGLTFSPKTWMWRELPWGLYYAAMDQLGSSNRLTNQPSSIRRIQSAADVWSGASCQTEVYYDRAYSSEDGLSNQIAKLEKFRGAVDSGPWHIVERAKRIAPNYVLAYTCY